MTNPLDIPVHILLAWLAGATVSLAGLIHAAKAVHKSIYKPLVSHVENIQTVAGMAPTLATLLPKMSTVVKMVLPNGGTSLVDKLDRIEASVTTLQMQHGTTAAIAEFTLQTHVRPAFHCDSHGKNIFVNPAYCLLLGADSSSLLGLGWRSFIHNLPDYDAVWRVALSEGRNCRFNITYLHATTGEPIYCVCQITALQPGNAARGFLGMLEVVIPDRGQYVDGRSPTEVIKRESSK